MRASAQLFLPILLTACNLYPYEGDSGCVPADEVCNAIDDDCDGEVDEDLTSATFTPADGVATDLSPTLGAGTATAPAELSLGEDGALTLECGLWYAEITATAGLSVQGDGVATLDGGGAGAPLTVSGGTLRIADLVVQNGLGVDGGCVAHDGDLLDVDGATFRDCVAEAGGAIWTTATSVSLSDSTFEGNAASIEGRWPDPSLKGGAVYAGISQMVIADSTFTNNDAGNDYSYQDLGGGAVYQEGGELRISGSTFSANRARNGYESDNQGGAVYTGGSASASDSAFTWNYAGGGAIYASGGALSVAGDLSLERVTLAANALNDKYGMGSGAAAAAQTIEITDSEVSGNDSDSSYYGALQTWTSGTCTDTSFSSNSPGDASDGSGLVDLSGCASGTVSW